jgi:hypothetical protein
MVVEGPCPVWTVVSAGREKSLALMEDKMVGREL